VAVCPFSPTFIDDEGNETRFDIQSLILNGPKDRSFLPTEEFKSQFGLGSEIVIIGLFRNHFGTDRNIPIVRLGNISAQPGELIHTKYGREVKAYLVEARSISGLSGSPVLALPDNTVVAAKVFRGLSADVQLAALIGLMHGHFDIPNLNEDVVTDDSEPERSVHTGIGVVIPVEKIVETINNPELVALRKSAAETFREKGIRPRFA
jgi:hypothetical protein